MSNTIYRSGKVERWHTNPEVPAQTVADHTWGMLALYFALCPAPDIETVRSVTFHDSPELFGGDLAYPFKRAYPRLAAEHDEISERLALEAGIPLGVRGAPRWLNLLDRLECYLYVKMKAPQLLHNRDWRQMQDQLVDWAIELNCQTKVMEMING